LYDPFFAVDHSVTPVGLMRSFRLFCPAQSLQSFRSFRLHRLLQSYCCLVHSFRSFLRLKPLVLSLRFNSILPSL
jgi:hypothetical protein